MGEEWVVGSSGDEWKIAEMSLTDKEGQRTKGEVQE